MEREAADERAALYRKFQEVGMGGLTRDERERLDRDRARQFVWQEGDIVLVPPDASEPEGAEHHVEALRGAAELVTAGEQTPEAHLDELTREKRMRISARLRTEVLDLFELWVKYRANPGDRDVERALVDKHDEVVARCSSWRDPYFVLQQEHEASEKEGYRWGDFVHR